MSRAWRRVPDDILGHIALTVFEQDDADQALLASEANEIFKREIERMNNYAWYHFGRGAIENDSEFPNTMIFSIEITRNDSPRYMKE